MSIRGDQIDLVASELEAAGTSSRQLSIKAGGITEAKLGFSWDTVDILASAFAYDGTRSNFTLTTAASANANVLDNSELLRNGVGGMGRVVATASENDWSLTGTTLSVHGDITATGDGYTIRYVIGSASGAATASGNTLWMGTLPQTPLHVKSDYFGTGSLDPKWEVWDAITPGGTVTAVENSEGLVLTRAADTENFNGIIQTLPGDTTFALTAEIELDLVGGKLTGAGVLVAENLAASGGNPSTGKLWMNYVAWDTVFGNMIYQFATWADFNSFTAVNFDSRLGSDRSRIFLRLYVDTSGETIRALGSRDGHRWLSLGGSISYAGSTLGSIGFVIRNESGDDTIMYSSMFRVDATSNPYLPVGGFVGVDGGGEQLETYQIEKLHPSFIADTMNAEFDGTLAPFVLGGATVAGTTDLITLPGSPTADVGTRHGSVFLQPPEGTTAQIRQALSLADGEELIISMSGSYAQGAAGNNDIHYGVSLNDSTVGYGSGTHDYFYYDGGNEQIDHWNGSTVVASMVANYHPGGRMYWRLIRSGNTIYTMFSLTGDVWCPFSEVDTVARGHTQFWIFFRTAALNQSKLVGPLEIRWCRHRTYSGMFPW